MREASVSRALMIVPQTAPPREVTWGAFPALCLVTAMGTLCVSLAYTASRLGNGNAEPLFWAGLLLIFVPSAVRVAMPAPDRKERIACLLLVAFALYGAKVMRDPQGFGQYDELLHWRTANDIVRSHHLLAANPLLPVSPLFPGLEIVANAVGGLGGLSIFAAGTFVIAAARFILILALFLLMEELTQSPRIAAIGTMLYMTNGNILFFDSQFAYESLGLALATVTIYTFIRSTRAPIGERAVWLSFAFLALAVTVTTHHVTSYILFLFLALWCMARFLARVLRIHRHEEPNPANLAIACGMMCLAWMVFAAAIVVIYLAEPIGSGLREFVRQLAGEQKGRQLFQAENGLEQPKWEQFVGIGAVLCILGGLPFGVWAVWKRERGTALGLALALGALIYPATLGLHFTLIGAEISSRSVPFLFVAIAFVLALGFIYWWDRLAIGAVSGAAVIYTVFVSLVFLGDVVTGTGPAVARLPGPYLVSADERSIEPQGLSAAAWVRAMFGPDHRVGADRINAELMGTYGEQEAITSLGTGIDLSPVYFSPTYTSAVSDVLANARLRYLVIDRRITQALPLWGYYISQGENDDKPHRTPVDPLALEKFDRVPHVSRIFDSGDIIIYDIQAVSGGS